MFSSLLSKKSHNITSSRLPRLNVTPMLLLTVKPKQGFIGEDYPRITTTNWFRIGMLPWLFYFKNKRKTSLYSQGVERLELSKIFSQ